MKIHCLFGARKCSVDTADPEIELMVAWDEYCIDGNPEGFDKAVKEAKKSWGTDLLAHREVTITIDEKKLREGFKAQLLEGELS